jgi:hypothetical protein
MVYIGLLFVVLFLLFVVVLCAQTKTADEAMLSAYKEMLEERARKEGTLVETLAERDGVGGDSPASGPARTRETPRCRAG